MIEDPTDRAIRIAGARMPYILGTGDYNPATGADVPWTMRDGQLGSDCAGFAICFCHRLRRHRPGFNVGAWSTVADDINTDSAVEDATHRQELFEPVIVPGAFPWTDTGRTVEGLYSNVQPGDLLVYKAIHLAGHPRPWVGHVAIVLRVMPDFDPTKPDWTQLWVAQCCGPNGREPAVIESDGSIWAHHDHLWGDVVDRRAVVIRVKAQ